jgi:hypothetical protein
VAADNDLSPLERVQSMFGSRGDGVSYQTKRALIEAGEGPPGIPAPGAPVQGVTAPAPITPAAIPAPVPIGGPSPSQELLERVRSQGAARGQENLRRILEQRAREVPKPEEPAPPAGGLYAPGMTGTRG